MNSKSLLKKIHKDESGMALMWAIALLIFTSIFSIALYRYTISNTKIGIEQSKDMSAFYIAEAGIELANTFLQKTIVDGNGTQVIPLTQSPVSTVEGKRLKDLTDTGQTIRMIDVIPYSSDTLELGAPYVAGASGTSNKLFLPYNTDASKAVGEVYVTIKVVPSVSSSMIEVTSVGTFYIDKAHNNVETATSIMKIDVNNHLHIEREYH